MGIIGGGHNGLVAAGYLAKAGFRVTVYERRAVLGGLCVNEAVLPGYQVPTVAAWYGMLRPEIMADLGLTLATYLPNPAHISVLGDGDYIIEAGTIAASRLAIAGVTEADHVGLAALLDEVFRAAEVLWPHLLRAPVSQAAFVAELNAAGLTTIADMCFTASLEAYLRRFITHEKLIAAYLVETFGPPTA